MREVTFDRNGKEEKANVIQAAGYNDGYYWEMSATVVFEDVEYSLQEAGSGSGYIPHYRSCSATGPKKLVSLMQLCENQDFEDNEDEWGYIEDAISCLMYDFFEYGCKESYEEVEGDDLWDIERRVDGKEVAKEA